MKSAKGCSYTFILNPKPETRKDAFGTLVTLRIVTRFTSNIYWTTQKRTGSRLDARRAGTCFLF